LLKIDEYINENYGDNEEDIDYGLLFKVKYKVLKRAFENFKKCKSLRINNEYKKFTLENDSWLDDYALYMAIKSHFGLVSWLQWDEDIKKREAKAVLKYKELVKEEIEYWKFIQYVFFKQWNKLKRYVNAQGIKIIGDIPIYVAEDSADVWSNPEGYLIDKITFKPIGVAGCPPDAFSETGQLWGNPIYDWSNMEKDDFKWWIKRVEESLKLYDVVRIDHFRGLESYWQIPYGDKTAENGKWVKGPSMKLFNAIKGALGEVNIIAEDLGYLTEEVREFLKETGFPGMKVLQFAFDAREESNYLPHTYDRNSVVYTGTHDNDTFRGWFEKTGSKEDVEYSKEYLALSEEEGYNWGFIRGAWSSVSYLSIALMQDFLNLGNEARINLPSTLGQNWRWRIKKGSYNCELADRIYKYTKMYGRCD
jgi:4-alpha-glucanotransferase